MGRNIGLLRVSNVKSEAAITKQRPYNAAFQTAEPIRRLEAVSPRGDVDERGSVFRNVGFL